jgi:DNA repair exonuclease SbcCD nuclease subunit
MTRLTAAGKEKHPVLPDYLNSELKRTIERAKQASDPDAIRFVFITDLHHEISGNQLHAARSVNRLSQELPLDAVICGGDNAINGPKTDVLAAQREIISELSSGSYPLFIVKGNHDDNSIEDAIDDVLFPDISYDLFVKSIEDVVMLDESNRLGMYYYYDLADKKTRIIVLNCIDIPYFVTEQGKLGYYGQWKYAFSNKQLNWMAHSALNLSGKPDREAWTIVIFSHASIIQDHVFGADQSIENENIAWGIVSAFQNGGFYRSVPTSGDFAQQVEADFSSQGPGCVAAVIFGHVHYDQVVVQDGIPLLSTLNATTNQDFGEAPERTAGTVTETAFDLVTINKKRKQIVLTRFGAGRDRIVDYGKSSQNTTII